MSERRPIRVALVGEYPAREDAIHEGGVQSVTHVLAHALAARDDIDCHVVCATHAPTGGDRRVGPLSVHFVSRPPVPRLLTMRSWDVPRLIRAIRAIAPDIVHGQGQDRHGLAAVAAGFPSVITPHGVIFQESRLLQHGALDLIGAWKKRMLDGGEREVFARARDMVMISPYLARVYGAMLSARQHSIENPVNPAFFSIERCPEPGRLLFVGMVSPRKCVPDLVEAMARLPRALSRDGASVAPRLRVVGPIASEELASTLRARIAAHGLEAAVDLVGAVDQATLVDEFSRAELLLLASREETAPQVIAQAMACGLPTVASAVGGIPELLEGGRSGVLFPFGDTAAAAAVIESLLTRSSELRQLSERARAAAAARFRPDEVAAQTVAVYREILARS
ncbi:MAG: glycosyltransferase family 4 protein [Candidatus Eisenbacteria bacterium]